MMIRTILLAFLAAFAAVPHLTAQRVTHEKFVEAVDQAIRLADDKGLDRIVRENPAHTITRFRTMYGTLKNKPDDQVAKAEVEALKAAWKRVFDSRTLELVAEWQDTLDLELYQRNEKAHQALAQAYRELDRLKNPPVRERKPWEALRDSCLKIAEAFEQVGNAFEAADTWGLVSQIYMSMPERTVTDRREAVYAIGRFKSLREKWEFTKDTYYPQNVNWMEAEKQRLESGEAEAGGGPGGESSKASGPEAFLVADADAKEIIAPLEFGILRKPPLDMCVQGGPVPMQWPSVTVEKVGPTKFPWFKANSLYLVRPSASKFGVTTDGTVKVSMGKAWQDIDVSSRLRRPSEFDFGTESAPRPYAAWFYVGSEQEPFMGFNQNLAPMTESATVFYKSAGQWSAKVAGTEILLFDDNSDGVLFEEDPFAYGIKDRHLGETTDVETPVPAFDGMQVGRGIEQPYSEWIQIDDQWYHVRGKNAGTQIGLRPADPEKLKTGEIQLDWTGPRDAKLEVLIVQGKDALSGARFNIAAGKPMTVPAGKYDVAFGRLVSGKGARILTADVFAGTMEPVEVKPGETAKVALGAPFTLDFVKKDVGAGSWQIEATTIRVHGVSGEIYAHVNGAAPAPEVLIAHEQNGRGAKQVAEFVDIRDPEIANQVAAKHKELGNQVGYYPIADPGKPATVIEIDVPDGWFVGLREKKNKLFGELQPVFK